MFQSRGLTGIWDLSATLPAAQWAKVLMVIERRLPLKPLLEKR